MLGAVLMTIIIGPSAYFLVRTANIRRERMAAME